MLQGVLRIHKFRKDRAGKEDLENRVGSTYTLSLAVFVEHKFESIRETASTPQ